MHLKVHRRKKDGKEHRYFRIVESRRVSRQRVVHRTVVYLGEINDSQQAAWRKTLEVFDEDKRDFARMSLFPDDREIAAKDVDALQVKLGAIDFAISGIAIYANQLPELGMLALPYLVESYEQGWQLYDTTGTTEDWSYNATGGFGYTPGNASDIVVVRAYYRWKILTPLFEPIFQNVNGGHRILVSTLMFRNEPYQ